MPRAVSEIFRNQAEAQNRTDLLLTFVTITDAAIVDPIRIVSEGNGGYSIKNGLTVNYKLGGHLFTGLPFKLTWLTDDERGARAHIMVPNLDKAIGSYAEQIEDAAEIVAAVYRASQFDTAFDADNAHNPIGTPTAEIATLESQYLRTVTADAMAVDADFGPKDTSTEPYPKIRTTVDRYPALYLLA